MNDESYRKLGKECLESFQVVAKFDPSVLSNAPISKRKLDANFNCHGTPIPLLSGKDSDEQLSGIGRAVADACVPIVREAIIRMLTQENAERAELTISVAREIHELSGVGE